MLVCMTHNKILPRSSQVLYSQGSLAIIDDLYTDENNNLIVVRIILLPPSMRFYTNVSDDWKKILIKKEHLYP